MFKIVAPVNLLERWLRAKSDSKYKHRLYLYYLRSEEPFVSALVAINLGVTDELCHIEAEDKDKEIIIIE